MISKSLRRRSLSFRGRTTDGETEPVSRVKISRILRLMLWLILWGSYPFWIEAFGSDYPEFSHAVKGGLCPVWQATTQASICPCNPSESTCRQVGYSQVKICRTEIQSLHFQFAHRLSRESPSSNLPILASALSMIDS